MPEPQSPIVAGAAEFGSCRLRDVSHLAKWRIWEGDSEVALGTAHHQGGSLVVAVAPGEWMVIGDKPNVDEVIDMTHVRAAVRLTGVGARSLLECVCALDLSESMTPNGAAARTLVAGVATELIRDDVAGEPSYLLLLSRSFARSVWDRLEEAASQPQAR